MRERDTDYSLWKATKRVKRRMVQNSLSRNLSNQAKLNIFAVRLENAFQPRDIKYDKEFPTGA